MATIRDVARISGVSSATVSNVLNSRSESVSTDTRERVLAAVRKLHYRPTPLEKSQKSILTRNLALVCADLSGSPIKLNKYFGLIFDGVLEAAAFQTWSVTVFVERMWSDTGDAVRRSYDGRCDGVIMLAPSPNSELALNLVERGVPIVSVGTTFRRAGISSVDIDNEQASSDLTRHLAHLGHSRIAYYGPGWNVASSAERSTGYRNTMKELGLAQQSRIYLTPTPEGAEDSGDQPRDLAEFREVPHGAEAFFRRAFESPEESPTAIICWNEATARQVVTALQSHGLRVPGEVSVVGFDDTQHSTSAQPYLTTMRQPLHEIGMRAVDLLISRIIDPSLPDARVRFKAEIVARESTGPRSRQNSHPCHLSRSHRVSSQTFPTNGGNSLNAS